MMAAVVVAVGRAADAVVAAAMEAPAVSAVALPLVLVAPPKSTA